MRPFATLTAELLRIAVPVLRGVATGEWTPDDAPPPATRAEALQRWDEATAEIDRLWPGLPPQRFQDVATAFGRWEGPGYWQLLYAIDNEVHHRSQGYVYLRARGVEPPAFYDRS